MQKDQIFMSYSLYKPDADSLTPQSNDSMDDVFECYFSCFWSITVWLTGFHQARSLNVFSILYYNGKPEYSVLCEKAGKYLCCIIIWIRSPAGEKQSPVFCDVYCSTAGLPHKDVHQSTADFDVVPALASLVLATYQHTQLSADVLVTSVDQLLHVQSPALQLFHDARHHLGRCAVRRHVQYVPLSCINLTVQHTAFNCSHPRMNWDTVSQKNRTATINDITSPIHNIC